MQEQSSITVHTVDLQFGAAESIAAFLVPCSEGAILIECGPESTWPHLEEGIRKLGYSFADIRYVLLTHIHFDHAGAAWKLAAAGADIFVHPSGLPHLAQPEKLWNSAKQIYGDDMERLWGKMESIPEAQLKAADDGDIIHAGDVTVEVIYTPGHAVHHNAYRIGDVIFTGDVGGVRINNGPVQPPCPPPDINIELWMQSLQKIRDRQPSALYLTHFGLQEDVLELLQELEDVLQDWSGFIQPYFADAVPMETVIPLFEAHVAGQLAAKGADAATRESYRYANPAYMSVTGLYRYWKLKSQGRI